MNHRSALYVAAILGLAALVAQSGLGARIGVGLLAYAPLDAQGRYSDVVTLAGLAGLLNFVVTANGVPALFTPLAQALADGTGLPLSGVLMLQVVGFSTPLLPYQAAPIVVAMGLARVPLRAGICLCLSMALLTYLLLLPLHYGWLHLLGWI
ncbi:hypothetical protein RPE78_00405 [Thioclava litoralis]|uniref:Uncharacterized protein n=1 Tax=Thioclava litoralis TaxID=3076557 RepID=A0ABZ1DZG6_9RHOB|nr:hypothetical protein RPE78_00405 [Thioclava sp. FTW29]